MESSANIVIGNTCKLCSMETMEKSRFSSRQDLASGSCPRDSGEEKLSDILYLIINAFNLAFFNVLYLIINFFHLGPLLSSVSAGAANLHLVGSLLCQPRLKMQTLVLAI